MDAATVIVMLSVHLMCSGGLLLIISRRMPPGRGLGTWAAALALYGSSYVGRLAGDLSDPAPWSFPADLGMVAALLLYERGLREFFGRPPSSRPLLAAFAVYAAAHVAIVFVFGVKARFVELNAVIGAGYMALAWRSFAESRRLGHDDPLRRPLLVLAAMMAVVSGLSFVRTGVIAQGGMALAYQGVFAQLFFAVASLVAVLAALILLWMVFIRLNRQLAELASRDALTRVFNRHGLDDVLARHFAARPAAPLTLLLVDIDHFKRINDAHGHAVGDAVLRAVADTLVAQLRGTDFVARVGGEEFVVGCAGVGATEAARLAQRLCASVAALELASPGGASVRCTVSVGVSNVFESRAEYEAAVRAADRALYAAKAAGRNRVEAFAPA